MKKKSKKRRCTDEGEIKKQLTKIVEEKIPSKFNSGDFLASVSSINNEDNQKPFRFNSGNQPEKINDLSS
jgi:hypothetical protein